jgi:hypothetical protein
MGVLLSRSACSLWLPFYRSRVAVVVLVRGQGACRGLLCCAYRYIPIDPLSGREGLLEIEPAEARVVRQMFEWVDRERLSARQVLCRLNDLKIPPKKGARTWAKSSVLRILQRETYVGIWHYNKYQSCEPLNPASNPRYRKYAKCSRRLRQRSEWLPLELPEPTVEHRHLSGTTDNRLKAAFSETAPAALGCGLFFNLSGRPHPYVELIPLMMLAGGAWPSTSKGLIQQMQLRNQIHFHPAPVGKSSTTGPAHLIAEKLYRTVMNPIVVRLEDSRLVAVDKTN